MSMVQDKDIAIWVCRHGNSADVVDFAVGSRPPINRACASHGEPLLKNCPRQGCPDPTYHPSDLDRQFHHCGEKIPWADMRAETAKALMEYDPFTSSLLGQRKKVDIWQAEDLIRKLSQAKEFTPRERQDLITPPSERLPVEPVRVPQEYGPLAEAKPAPAQPEVKDMSRFIDWGGTRELRKLESKWAEDAKRQIKKGGPVRREKLGLAAWNVAKVIGVILAAGISGVVTAYLLGWLKAIGLAPPQ